MTGTIFFYIFAALIGASAILAVVSRNLIHSALYLGSALFGVAALYVLLDAHFLAAIQVLIYIGAVVVLTIFVINLTKKAAGKSARLINRHTIPAGMISFAMLLLFLASLLKTGIFKGEAPEMAPANGPAEIGRLFLADYMIPFEVVSVLLLAALIGAIVIIGKDDTEESG